MAFTIKQGDSAPNLRATLVNADTTPIDLTTAIGVSLIVKIKGAADTDPPYFDNPCDITDALAGEVEYDWDIADTASIGEYNGEFEIDWGGGDLQTVPNDKYFDIIIVADLD